MAALAVAGPAAASAPPEIFGVTLLGDESNLTYPFWFPDDLANHMKFDALGQAGSTADVLARCQRDGIHTTYQDAAAAGVGTVGPGGLPLILRERLTDPLRIAVVLAGRQDLSLGASAVSIQANLANVYAYLRKRGSTVIPVVPLPNVLAAQVITDSATKWGLIQPAVLSPAQRAVWGQVRAWIMRQPHAVDTASLASLSDGTQGAPTFAEQKRLADLIGEGIRRARAAQTARHRPQGKRPPPRRRTK